MNLSEKDEKNIWHPYTPVISSLPVIPIVKACGSILYDEHGNEYIDGISSWWVNTHGHAHPFISQAIKKQFDDLDHIMFAGFTHPPAIELSEKLLKHLPESHCKLFFSDNGSTAVEIAIKMAIQYWFNKGEQRKKVIALENAYHGDTFGSMSVSGRSVFSKPFSQFLFDTIFIEAPVKGNEELSIKQLKEYVKNNKVAAFIYEPLVQGAAGMVMYEPKALDELLKICEENNVITIADEVFTGFYRTGTFFASQQMSVSPDLICLSKGLTGGVLPLAVTSCSEKIFSVFKTDDKFKTFLHGHSFTGNPVACAAAIANISLFEEESFPDKIKLIEEKHNQFLKELSERFNFILVRQKSTIAAIEINNEESSGYLNSLKDYLYSFFISRRVILRPLGNVVYIVPPYCITNKELDRIYEVITECLAGIKENNFKSIAQWMEG
jgi:adenosylmethionine---8-amino-7-oxononanoate aminotransferase